MTPDEYRRIRERLGSQQRVAEAIPGLHPVTISNRERGAAPIDGEAEYALRYLAEHPEFVHHGN